MELADIEKAYNIAKSVLERRITPTVGKRQLAQEVNIIESSAQDYIYNFRYMIQGRRFTRTLTSDSIDYYLRSIRKDYSREQYTMQYQQ